MGGIAVLAQAMSQTLIQKSEETIISNLELLQVNSYNTVIPFFIMYFILESKEVIVYEGYGGKVVIYSFYLSCLVQNIASKYIS